DTLAGAPYVPRPRCGAFMTDHRLMLSCFQYPAKHSLNSRAYLIPRATAKHFNHRRRLGRLTRTPLCATILTHLPPLPTAKNDRQAAASTFAQHPQLVSMIEGKLGKLVGRSSGYIESLPAPVRRRITGLRGIQKEHSKLEAQFQEEVLQLEKKYFAKFTP